ncbi:MAG: hypothetical protein B7Z45_08325, partial [Azorhizobium sp. 12-66-6]
RDAAETSGTLGIQCDTLESAPLAEALADALSPLHTQPASLIEDAGERVRGVLRAAAADLRKALLICTAPRTALMVGAHGCDARAERAFAPLSDVDPIDVAAFARLRNGWKPVGSLGPDGVVIPEHLVDPPDDPAPAILSRLSDPGASVASVVAEGFERTLVTHLADQLYRSEARREAPPGVALTQKALGRARRMPLLHLFRDDG